VLLINANYAPLAVVTLPRAMRLLARQKAEVLETDSRAITTGTEGVTVARPLVMRMRSYVRAKHIRHPNVSRPLVITRDGETCQYCGGQPRRMMLSVASRIDLSVREVWGQYGFC
jgi:5-methylcytosine-specific restriction endonuclease McrA